ncbi:MAG: hypothetical protein KC448_01835 [Yoonia sp.]|mgnify:CR=1 FL=1|nr:hypothetical protein [Yoonia sp.]
MSLLKRLFGAKTEAEPNPCEVYKDHRIIDAPMKEGSKFRMSARIELDVDGETKVHHLIRADTFDSQAAAAKAAGVKAKQVINEQGKDLFR